MAINPDIPLFRQKDLLNKDFLKQQYVENKLSTVQIAKMAGCSAANIYLHLNKFNIPVRSKIEAKKYTTVRNDLESGGVEPDEQMQKDLKMLWDLFSKETEKHISEEIDRLTNENIQLRGTLNSIKCNGGNRDRWDDLKTTFESIKNGTFLIEDKMVTELDRIVAEG